MFIVSHVIRGLAVFCDSAADEELCTLDLMPFMSRLLDISSESWIYLYSGFHVQVTVFFIE